MSLSRRSWPCSAAWKSDPIASNQIIRAANDFGAEVIVLDHLQGFVSGHLNNSDTATALAMESNKIVAATGAAVVQTAHISKANINAQDVFAGFTTGSLAFENAARQMTGVIPLPDGDAKKFGLDETLLHGGFARRVLTSRRLRSCYSSEYRTPELVHPVEGLDGNCNFSRTTGIVA